MIDELSQLCPIQFVEGINEVEKPTDGPFWKPQNPELAICYRPNRTYTLSKIALFGSPPRLLKPDERSAKLYTGKNNTPSGNLISVGKLLIPAEAIGEDWLQIELKAVVIFRGQQYWIALEDDEPKFAIGIATDGIESMPQVRKPGYEWIALDKEIRYMLKFFGRVLPVG